MIRIDIYNHEVNQAIIEGDSDEILAELGLIIDQVIFTMAETPEDKEKILDNFISKFKEAWKEFDEGGQADA